MKLRNHLRLIELTFVALLFLAFGARAEQTSSLRLSFGAGDVTVSGVAGRHKVIVFGVGIGLHGTTALLTRDVESRADDDGDGNVTFTFERVPQRSVWVGVDFESGDYVVATPSGVAPKALVVPDESWKGNRADIDFGRQYLEVLLVRRRIGAWTLRMADGGNNDADGTSNAVSRLRLERMQILTGEEKGPSFAVPKDLLVAIDPRTLDTFVSEAR